MVTFRTDMMGTIYITNDINFVNTVPDGAAKIISLDEDGYLDPNNPNVIMGTCLLPPIEALIAEADGDEDLYDMSYITYLNSPAVQPFITAMIAALYRKQSLLLFAPQMYENSTVRKLRRFMWEFYGINIGVVGADPNDPTAKCSYDTRCIPIWLNMMYMDNIIDLVEYLYMYPDNVDIGVLVMNKLISEVKPVGNSYEDRVASIESLRSKIKKNPNTIQPIYDTRCYDALLRKS